MNSRNEVAGYDLFVGLTDKELQARNRAVVLRNMFEDGAVNGKLGTADAALMLGYLQRVPEEERPAVLQHLRGMNINVS